MHSLMLPGESRRNGWPTTLHARCSGLHNICAKTESVASIQLLLCDTGCSYHLPGRKAQCCVQKTPTRHIELLHPSFRRRKESVWPITRS